MKEMLAIIGVASGETLVQLYQVVPNSS